jgi:ligand-binding sensor domain-containing protein/signal transduction histidine kinase
MAPQGSFRRVQEPIRELILFFVRKRPKVNGCTRIRAASFVFAMLASITGLSCVPAAGLDPGRRISQFGHTAWRIQDGFFNGAPNAITQTADGYLWIGTSAGLVRFDGVRFTPWTSPDGRQLPSDDIISLLGARDGSLWIGTATGLARWKDEKLTVYNNAHGRINDILEDHKGQIWVARARLGAEHGALCWAGETSLRCYGEADGVGVRTAATLAQDPQGNLWIAGSTGLTRWKPGSYSTISLEPLKATSALSGIEGIAPRADGSVLVGMSRAGKGLGLQTLSQGRLKPFLLPGFDGSTLRVSRLWLDRENTLWVATIKSGLYRIDKNRVDHFGSEQGLSSDSTVLTYQDHEGNLWVVTAKGVDEFRDLNIATYSTAEGISSDDVMSVLASRKGNVWVGDIVLDSIRDGQVSPGGPVHGLPRQRVTSLFEDHAGTLWVGIDDGLAVFENGKYVSVTRRDGTPTGVVVAMTQDTDGDLWVLTTGNPQRLARIRNREVAELLPLPQSPIAVAADREKGIWLTLGNGDLAHYRDGNLKTFPNQGLRVRQMVVTVEGSVLGTSSEGLVGVREGKVQHLATENGLPCNNLAGLVLDDHGALWLYAECGLLEISKPELEKWWRNPDSTLSVGTFDVFDGLQFGSSPFRPNVTRGPDGKLWFVNGNFVQMIDPAKLIRNTIPPPVHIEAVIADHKSYSPERGFELPAHTRDLQIDYTALSFVAPQKVRFRYRLDGREDGWQDSGNRRQAFYTDLRPGKYRFVVVACNNDGVWNDNGASLNFMIAPSYYQQAWFQLLCASLLLGTLWLFYWLRLRRATAQVQVRLGARLEERERIARELHDTLLQGFQGLMLRFQAIMKRIPETESAYRMMEETLERADQVLLEGRDRVRGLRDEEERVIDLADELARYGKERAEFHNALFSLTRSGASQPIICEVQNEAYRIGREALANAFAHAEASRIDVEIDYGRGGVFLRIRDDGKGIDQRTLSSGRAGHWGLPGMRERAQKIGARLQVSSRAGIGTEVNLTIPAQVAYFNRSRKGSLWVESRETVP